MNLNRFTEKAQEAIVAGQRETENRKHSQFDVDQLLYALATQSDGVVPQVLLRSDLDPRTVVAELERVLDAAPKLQISAQPVLGPGLRRVLERAEDEAKSFGDEYVSTEHLLLAAFEATPNAPSVKA